MSDDEITVDDSFEIPATIISVCARRGTDIVREYYRDVLRPIRESLSASGGVSCVVRHGPRYDVTFAGPVNAVLSAVSLFRNTNNRLSELVAAHHAKIRQQASLVVDLIDGAERKRREDAVSSLLDALLRGGKPS